MLIKYSDNIIKQIVGIVANNWKRLIFFIVVSTLAVIQSKIYMSLGWMKMELPVVPVTILGGALAIFLGFRNNSAYDRWWEARKVWGGIVNNSRSFATLIISFSSSVFSDGNVSEEQIREWQKEMIYRHIGWLYALRIHLRKEGDWSPLSAYIKEEELDKVMGYHNKPAQIINRQGLRLKNAFEHRFIEHFRHMELTHLIKEFYDLQGKAERIKNTVFPYYYNYFTRLFLWLFVICLPFTLIHSMGWGAIPMSVAISFVFSILEKSGGVTEDPFEGRAADTPMTTIVRNIEIDLKEMLGVEDIPLPEELKVAKYGAIYQS